MRQFIIGLVLLLMSSGVACATIDDEYGAVVSSVSAESGELVEVPVHMYINDYGVDGVPNEILGFMIWLDYEQDGATAVSIAPGSGVPSGFAQVDNLETPGEIRFTFFGAQNGIVIEQPPGVVEIARISMQVLENVTDPVDIIMVKAEVSDADNIVNATFGSGQIHIVPLQPTGELTKMTVQINNLLDGPDETLHVDLQSGMALIWNSATGLLEITGDNPDEIYTQVLRTLTYHNTALEPDLTPREIGITVYSEDVVSNTGLITVNILIPVTNIVVDMDVTDAGYNYSIDFLAGSGPLLIAEKAEIRVNE